MKILNLYAGIGGNRKLWGDEHEITAIEINPEIAKIYQDFFPNDKVIVGDAHEYLRLHYKEFDFIWSSPPCPTHSRMCFSYTKEREMKYPDMNLYEEIIFLKTWFKGKWVVENVISYYKPLIEPQKIQSHYFWGNFIISKYNGKRLKVRNDVGQTCNVKMKAKGMIIKDFHKYKGDKRTLLNNAIEGELGLHIIKELKEGGGEEIVKGLKSAMEDVKHGRYTVKTNQSPQVKSEDGVITSSNLIDNTAHENSETSEGNSPRKKSVYADYPTSNEVSMVEDAQNQEGCGRISFKDGTCGIDYLCQSCSEGGGE